MIGKVDRRTRSPPFRLVLGWVFNLLNLLLILHFWHALAPARRHLGRSGGWAFSFVFLLYIHVMVFDLSYLWGTAPSPALHHLGWPWLGAPLLRSLPLGVPDAYSQSSSPPLRVALALHLPTQLTTIEVGPGLGTFSLPFTIFSTLFPPLWPPRPLESKVIQIQSDHPPAFSPPVAAMERSKVICSIQVWGKDVGLSCKVSLDFAGLGSPCSWAPLLFLLLDVALLHRRPPHLWDGQVYLESLVSLFSPPFSLLPKSVWVAFWRHHSLFFPIFLSSMCCSLLPSSSWADTACTGEDFRDAYSLGATDCVSGFPPFGHLFYSGLAGPRYLLEENFWEESECRLAACPRPLFHAVSPSPGLVKLPCALQPTGMR